MLSPLKHVLSEYCTILVKMYYDHFVKPTILTTKVNYELMVDIKYLLTLAVMLSLVKAMKTLVVFV